MQTSKCFDIFISCIDAMHNGELIKSEGSRDKEFHFQNWCEQRIKETGLLYELGGRNAYPDFRLVEHMEGYEIKGLRYPGRERDFDANSNLPTGFNNGRQMFYIFGRYPSDPSEHKTASRNEYPIIDLVVVHGDFMCANREYVHQNKHISGFGTYGDIKIRDRKMYIVPTPFALVDGTTGLSTLIVPDTFTAPDSFVCVGDLVRTETEQLVVGYAFNLANNAMTSKQIKNPNAGKKHVFKAYRHKLQSNKPVSMRNRDC